MYPILRSYLCNTIFVDTMHRLYPKWCILRLVFFKRSGVERIFFNGTEEEWHGYELKLDPFNLDFKGVYVSDPSGDTEYGGKTYRRIELPSSKTK